MCMYFEISKHLSNMLNITQYYQNQQRHTNKKKTCTQQIDKSSCVCFEISKCKKH
jgi:hypothetical protein